MTNGAILGVSGMFGNEMMLQGSDLRSEHKKTWAPSQARYHAKSTV